MATYTKEKDVKSTLEEDPQAREAMKEVFGNTARWPAGFNRTISSGVRGARPSVNELSLRPAVTGSRSDAQFLDFRLVIFRNTFCLTSRTARSA